jgi:hypothetical protein
MHPERLEALDTLAHGLPLLSVDVRIDVRQAAGIVQAAIAACVPLREHRPRRRSARRTPETALG